MPWPTTFEQSANGLEKPKNPHRMCGGSHRKQRQKVYYHLELERMKEIDAWIARYRFSGKNVPTR